MAKGFKTGGRLPGSINKRTKEVQALADSLAERGLTPLEIMLKSMEMAWEQRNTELACAIAKDAAPYMHARLANIEHSGEITTSKVIRAPEPSKSTESWEKTHVPEHMRMN